MKRYRDRKKYKRRTPNFITSLVFILSFLLGVIKRRNKKREYLNSDIRKIDAMTGEQFEEYVRAHFEKQGYKVKNTPKSNDYGADLIMSKGGIKTIVQLKRYRDKVGNKAVQEIIGAKGFYNADKCMVVTNSFFTANAKILAAANGVELWDRYKLINVFQINKKGENQCS